MTEEEEDRKLEEEYIRKALSECGYPEWTINKVKKDRSTSAASNNATKTDKSKGLAVIPCIEGLSARIARVFRKHGFSTAMKPNNTLRSMLVHLKDKLLTQQKSEAIYEIPCADCPKSYICETGLSFGTRQIEHQHQKEVEKFELKPYTRSSCKPPEIPKISKFLLTFFPFHPIAN